MADRRGFADRAKIDADLEVLSSEILRMLGQVYS